MLIITLALNVDCPMFQHDSNNGFWFDGEKFNAENRNVIDRVRRRECFLCFRLFKIVIRTLIYGATMLHTNVPFVWIRILNHFWCLAWLTSRIGIRVGWCIATPLSVNSPQRAVLLANWVENIPCKSMVANLFLQRTNFTFRFTYIRFVPLIIRLSITVP